MKLDAAWLAGPRRWWLAGAAVLLVGGIVTWLVWPEPEPPRSRQFLEYTACLLTDERALAGPEAAEVWAGMGEASAKTLVQTEYLAVTGDQSVANALTYLNGLAPGHCDLLFAVGTGPTGAVQAGAATFPKVRFFPVAAGTSGGNVTRVEGDLRATASRIVIEAVSGSS